MDDDDDDNDDKCRQLIVDIRSWHSRHGRQRRQLSLRQIRARHRAARTDSGKLITGWPETRCGPTQRYDSVSRRRLAPTSAATCHPRRQNFAVGPSDVANHICIDTADDYCCRRAGYRAQLSPHQASRLPYGPLRQSTSAGLHWKSLVNETLLYEALRGPLHRPSALFTIHCNDLKKTHTKSSSEYVPNSAFGQILPMTVCIIIK